MGAPEPRAFAVLADQARELLTHDRCGEPDPETRQPRPLCLSCSYRWAYYAAHDRSVTDEVKVTAAGSTPTEAVYFSKHALRQACREAHQAVKALASLEGLLAGALDRSDPRHHLEARYASGTMIVTRSQLEDARQAKRRREERGEGFGDA